MRQAGEAEAASANKPREMPILRGYLNNHYFVPWQMP
jgi:hypothetical protein